MPVYTGQSLQSPMKHKKHRYLVRNRQHKDEECYSWENMTHSSLYCIQKSPSLASPDHDKIYVHAFVTLPRQSETQEGQFQPKADWPLAKAEMGMIRLDRVL